MDLKIPPPIIGLIVALAIWASNRLFPELRFPLSVGSSLGIVLALLGLMIELVSVFLFIQAKTTVNPLAPQRSQHLVTSGFFRISRNPMYLGMLLLLLGFVLWLRQPLGLIFIGIFVWYITRFQIKPEEQILLDKFGAEYEDYCARVRRWL